jgi:hypothetical protein
VTDFSIFETWRRLLALFCCVYAALRVGAMVTWWRAGEADAQRPEILMRRYVLTLFLRTRFRRQWFELLQIAVLTVVLIYIIRLH